MTQTDWLVLTVTLAAIILYGLYKSRTTKNLEGYFLSNKNLPWYIVLLSIMGTQASAVTFLSGPGQAYADGMRFVQYYFGLPLAMVVISITFVPAFNKLQVFTAYEYLEKRFDAKTRTFTSLLFLLQRGLSTGISIYAPSIIISTLFGWDIFWTNIIMGGLLIIYTVTGGAKAVAHTQKIQLLIIFSAMFLAAYTVVALLPAGVGFTDALHIGGKMGKLNVITTGTEKGGFDWGDRYNIWSGIIGGFFFALSYFGTDQSQVGRYLTAQNNTESKLGLLMNGLVKVPMQFAILLVGVLIFSFYQFYPTPLSFNDGLVNDVQRSSYKDSVDLLQKKFNSVNALKEKKAVAFAKAVKENNQNDIQTLTGELKFINDSVNQYRKDFTSISKKVNNKETNDTNYVFLSFVKQYLPAGLKGLLIAVIFLAGWGSIAAALNSLASSTVIDFHKRQVAEKSDLQDYRLSRLYTLGWGVFCIFVAQFAGKIGQSLIEAVNVLGSLFYGVILGVFLVAFYFRKINGSATFYSAVIIEALTVIVFFNEKIPGLSFLPDFGFLWLTAFGAIGVILVGALLQNVIPASRKVTTA
jgi:solute:Na+ symporter, SSS family